MIVQTIEISLSKGRAPELLAHLGESNRQIEMIPDVTLPETAGAEVNIVKPDGTFVIQTAAITDGHIIVTLPDQACTAKGLSHYILKITDTGTVIYSAYGNIFVDDHLITDAMIESIAEANGYQFPDDFLTDDKLEANPSGSATDTLYRLKIFDTIYGLSGGGGGADVEANPTGTPTDTLDALRVDDNIYEVEKPIPVEANPSGSVTDTLEKIKIGQTIYGIEAANIIYSTNERLIGVWLDGKPLYQITVEAAATIPNNSWFVSTLDSTFEIKVIADAQLVQSGNSTVPVPWYRSGSIYTCHTVTANEISLLQVGVVNIIGYRYTIQYTKTTDTV